MTIPNPKFDQIDGIITEIENSYTQVQDQAPLLDSFAFNAFTSHASVYTPPCNPIPPLVQDVQYPNVLLSLASTADANPNDIAAIGSYMMGFYNQANKDLQSLTATYKIANTALFRNYQLLEAEHKALQVDADRAQQTRILKFQMKHDNLLTEEVTTCGMVASNIHIVSMQISYVIEAIRILKASHKVIEKLKADMSSLRAALIKVHDKSKDTSKRKHHASQLPDLKHKVVTSIDFMRQQVIWVRSLLHKSHNINAQNLLEIEDAKADLAILKLQIRDKDLELKSKISHVDNKDKEISSKSKIIQDKDQDIQSKKDSLIAIQKQVDDLNNQVSDQKAALQIQASKHLEQRQKLKSEENANRSFKGVGASIGLNAGIASINTAVATPLAIKEIIPKPIIIGLAVIATIVLSLIIDFVILVGVYIKNKTNLTNLKCVESINNLFDDLCQVDNLGSFNNPLK